MARIEKTVFISYRRTDVYTALAVYQDLTDKGYDVFFDYTSIPSGDFEQIIISNIRARAHFVLILTPTALDRCNEPGDWLRREIETAIDEKRNVIPLFFKGFKFGAPSVAEKLTGKLASINRYNGLNVHEDYFHAAMERLSSQFLNVPSSAVLHPISHDVQKAVKAEQIAADKAIEEKGGIRELIGSSITGKEAGPKFNLRTYGIGIGILLITALVIYGIQSGLQTGRMQEFPTQIVTTSVVATNTKTPQAELTPTSTGTPVTPTPMPTFNVGSTLVSEKDGMPLLYVPAGIFIMGEKAEDALTACQIDRPDDCQLTQFKDAEPVHEVYLDAFWIDKFEVTVRMYFLCAQAGVCKEPKDKTSNGSSDYYGNVNFDNNPMIYVDWDMAKTYCEWAHRRLPSEAEWEKSARGENAFTFPWGTDVPNNTLLNYYKRVGDTTEVGKYPDGVSHYGALDMAGNVWEWVADWYDETYYASSPSSNPLGPESGQERIVRGGSWNNLSVYVRSSFRNEIAPDHADYAVGFRCAMDAE